MQERELWEIQSNQIIGVRNCHSDGCTSLYVNFLKTLLKWVEFMVCELCLNKVGI
jgi:hypothetical protein